MGANDAALLTALAQQAALALRMGNLARELGDRARSEALLEERARLAREIHDGLAQGFTGILMQLGALEETVSLAGNAAVFVRRAADLARSGLDDARRSVMALQPDTPRRGGLALALRELADANTVAGRRTCDYEGLSGPTGLSPARELEIHRIAQEAVTNAVRHAQARRIAVRLLRVDAGLRLEVEDDGVGMPDAATAAPAGFGLANIRARAVAIGGRIEIDTAPGRGTCLRLHLGPGGS